MLLGAFFCVIARSAAAWQSPGTNHQTAPKKQALYREIPTAFDLGMTVVAEDQL